MSWEVKLKRVVERAERAGADRDRAIREAAAAGLSLREIAAATGLSHQRIHQIVKAHR